MPAKKTSAQLQREIDEALTTRHKQAREQWLSLQAGPRYRERQAAYDEMGAASRAIDDARGVKRSHATLKGSAPKSEIRLPAGGGAQRTKKAVAVMKAFNAKVEKLLDQAGAKLHHEMKGGPLELDHREFVLETKAGPAFVTPLGDWVAVRFEDPEAAAKLVGTRSGLNPYSGKWNQHYFGRFINEAVSDVARWLKMIAA